MNKVVIEHYPASRLPEDLKAAVGGAGSVTITVERELTRPLRGEELVAQLRAEKLGKRPEDGVSSEEAVGRIRVLRDEWED